MAGRTVRARALFHAMSAATVMAFGVLATAPAIGQTAAPIVYKSPSHTTVVRSDNRGDALALNVAPHAPIPSFSNAAPVDALDLRPGAPQAAFGPAPFAAGGTPEPVGLKSVPPEPRQAVAPHAGPPYQIAGRWYVPAHEPNYNEVGIASWYGPTFHGKLSASGEVFDQNALTAAHPTLPLPSLVRVTNLENNRAVIVRVNDRGPFADDRIIDLSKAAGAALDMHDKGTAKVRVEYVGAAPAKGGGKILSAPEQLVAFSEPKAAAPVANAAPAPVNGFYLQAGSFTDLGNAHALIDSLSRAGDVSIETANVNDAVFYRVMVGPWGSREEAEAARSAFSGSASNALVVARNG